MSINEFIISTLAAANVPVIFHVYTGAETTYITFFEIVDVPKLHAENKLKSTQTSIQVDVWSKGNYESLVATVKSLMGEAGFLYSGGRGFYEPDTKIYHYALTYNYKNKVEN